MLLYVNKKEVRRKKIKIFLITIFSILFCFANIMHFKKNLHTPLDNINSYQTITLYPLLPSNIPSVMMFVSKNKKTKHILLSPNITKENAYKIVKALNSNKKATKVFLTHEIKDNILLQNLINHTQHEISENQTPNTIIITSDITKLIPLIYKDQLYPKSITYSDIKDVTLSNIINAFFTPDFIPQNPLETEQQNLQSFANDYKKELLDLIKNPSLTKIQYSKQYTLLKNASFCIKTNTKTTCNISKDFSFIKSLTQTLKTFLPSEKIQKLIILTSFEPISNKTILKHAGLLFKYEKRQAILLPEEITPSSFDDIKIKAGINPSFTTNTMKYYQFKTVEINLNDNI